MAIQTARVQVNGRWHDLAYNADSRQWEAVITAPGSSVHQPGGVYNLTLEATNETGSTVTADGSAVPGLRLKVQERVKPVLTVVSPGPGYVTDNMVPVIVDVTDDDSGADMSSFVLAVDGVSVPAEYTDTPGGYRATWTPTEPHTDGAHVIHAQVTDYDGNTGETEGAFTVDTVPPWLWIFNCHFIMDTAALEITGQTGDETSSPVTVCVECGDFTGSPTVREDGRFSLEIPLSVGDNTVMVRATDRAGLETAAEILVIRLVTDRTQADVDRLKVLLAAGWDSMSETDRAWYMDTVCRGAYNAEDMNRVNRAMAYLDRRLREHGYLTGYRDQGIIWTVKDIPKREQKEAYLANVEAIRAVFPLEDAPPVPADMDPLTLSKANDIETILTETDAVFPLLEKSVIYAGEAMAGEF